ncbi:MAG: bifunctional DNA-formamidopyrimidine glycosylase/DNA-(apurinic or apyrimidinic site) lyase [Candidatus Marinimicrobia bacterium]|nr:bifunctional DNA-formamidopyrimidine glycosylase/DNA-(apurinic or apyrimidinic site) lyase [Candidatus Neomarinimicrobiota bacterium]
MPELPEVQIIVNDLINAGLIGKTITDAKVFWKKTIALPSAEEFIQTISGQTISNIRRRAKYIIFDFQSGLHLLIHLRMSGKLQLISPNTKPDKHEHVILHFSDKFDLHFHNTRKFGRMYLINNPDLILGKLGPEPQADTFTAEIFKKRIQSKNRQLKPLLLDQTFIAGLGNIYVDEALWEAKLHPQQIASRLSGKKLEALYHAIRFVLQKGIDNLGTTLGNGKSNFYSTGQRRGRNAEQLNVFHRTDQPCPRCNTSIVQIIVGQRSTHICPKCQKNSK